MSQMVARVVLRKARTYNFGGRRWIKDVPGTVSGEENIIPYQQNGYFHVTVVKKGSPKKEAKVEKSEKKSSDEKKSSSSEKPAKGKKLLKR